MQPTIVMNNDAEVFYLMVLHLNRQLREVDRATGLSGVRFSILASLQFHGTANLRDLAEDEKVSRPAITRLIRDMALDGQVVTGKDPKDGRGVRVEITRQGRTVLLNARKQKIAIVDHYLQTLTASERRVLKPVAKKLAEAVWP